MQPSQTVQAEKHIFVSYSHEDDGWRQRLVDVLAPSVRSGVVNVWHDRQITTGEEWSDVIRQQIERANVAVLMVSPSFLASEYVSDVELPLIVSAARNGRLTLVWVPVSASLWDMSVLAPFQAAISPDEPLDAMAPFAANAALVSIARAVLAGRTLADIGSGMHIVDSTYDQLRGAGPRRVAAQHTGEAVEFVESESRVIETITWAELTALPDDQHELVQTLKQSMEVEFRRWSALRPGRSTLTPQERLEYEDAGRKMCGELNSLLDFIVVTLGKQLQDHYAGVRYACNELIAKGDEI